MIWPSCAGCKVADSQLCECGFGPQLCESGFCLWLCGCGFAHSCVSIPLAYGCVSVASAHSCVSANGICVGCLFACGAREKKRDIWLRNKASTILFTLPGTCINASV